MDENEQQHCEIGGVDYVGEDVGSEEAAVDGDGQSKSTQLTDVELIQGHCVELFSMRDFVMEPQVIATMMAFFQAGGQPERVVELLSNNYHGLGQFANLLACWLADLELDDAGASSSSSTSQANLLENAQSKIDGCPLVRDCFESTVCQMIKRRFSSEAVDTIFEMDGTEGIDWIPMLISHQCWRRLVFELAEHFPHCLMLNFAIKLISDAGFQHEISNVNTAAQQLDIFSRVFLASFELLLTEYAKCDGDQLVESYQRHFRELKRVSCHSEQTFLYTQMLLNCICWKESGKKSAICATVVQQLRVECGERLQDIFAAHIGMMQSCVSQIHAHIVQAVLTMLAKGLNPADVSQLHQAYSDESHPPPMELIRNRAFLDLLIDALFSANGPRIHFEHRPKYVFLLAYACAVAERKPQDGERTQNLVELRETEEQLEQLVNILHSPEDILLSLEALLRLCRTPVVAAGILHYLKTLLLREDLLAEPSSLHFVLIDQVARVHPNLHPRVFKLLCALYDHQSNRNEVAEVVMERQRHVVDRFVHLLCCGMAIPEKMISMFKEAHIDISLVRYFGVEVLELVAPPYSKQFIVALLPIVADREVFDRVTLDKHPTAREFLHSGGH
uniref:Negative elongation factor D n=1 Tax=Globodera pallida TaxID=36090 RepID=A0A183BQ11_GLOPA